MAAIIIILVVLMIILLILICSSDFDVREIFGLIGIILITIGLYFWCKEVTKPTAIEVYQGKTELKYEGVYKDSIFIKTDSTVIFTSRSN